MKLSEKIIKLRKENNLSQEEFGDKINVSRQAISKWENGESNPEIEKIREISKVFKVSYEYLLNDEVEIEDTAKKIKVEKKSFLKKIRSSILAKIIFKIFIIYILFSGYKLIVLLRWYSVANSFSENDYSMTIVFNNISKQFGTTEIIQEFTRAGDELIEKTYSYTDKFESLAVTDNNDQLPYSIRYYNFSKNESYCLNWNVVEKCYEFENDLEEITVLNDNLVKKITLDNLNKDNLLKYAFNPLFYYVSPFTKTMVGYLPDEIATWKIKLNNDGILESITIAKNTGDVVNQNYSYDYCKDHKKQIINPKEEYKDYIK